MDGIYLYLNYFSLYYTNVHCHLVMFSQFFGLMSYLFCLRVEALESKLNEVLVDLDILAEKHNRLVDRHERLRTRVKELEKGKDSAAASTRNSDKDPTFNGCTKMELQEIIQLEQSEAAACRALLNKLFF